MAAPYQPIPRMDARLPGMTTIGPDWQVVDSVATASLRHAVADRGAALAEAHRRDVDRRTWSSCADRACGCDSTRARTPTQ